jgi:hypothetical protein
LAEGVLFPVRPAMNSFTAFATRTFDLLMVALVFTVMS